MFYKHHNFTGEFQRFYGHGGAMAMALALVEFCLLAFSMRIPISCGRCRRCQRGAKRCWSDTATEKHGQRGGDGGGCGLFQRLRKSWKPGGSGIGYRGSGQRGCSRENGHVGIWHSRICVWLLLLALFIEYLRVAKLSRIFLPLLMKIYAEEGKTRGESNYTNCSDWNVIKWVAMEINGISSIGLKT